MSENFVIEKVDGGYRLDAGGRALVFLRGEEGSLVPEAIAGATLSDDKQKCFDECFAKSDGTAGAAKKCAKACGLE